MSESKNGSGVEAQVVQSYGIDSLVSVSPIIRDVREFQYRRTTDGRIVIKQIHQYPSADENLLDTGRFTDEFLSRQFGKRAPAIRTVLRDRLYCRDTSEGDCILTWKFRILTEDDFDIRAGSEMNSTVYRSLDALLWTPMPETAEARDFVAYLSGKLAGEPPAVHRMDEGEYWYRIGIDIIAVRFDRPPGPELVSLLDLRLQFIQVDKMQNYINIISSYNADISKWMMERNRNRLFFEIVGHLLAYTWRPFDMKTCEVSIDASGDAGPIVSGTLRVDFSEGGEVTTQFDRMEKRFPEAKDPQLEFSVNEVALRAAATAEEASTIGLRMLSRSPGNVHPRRNMLIHRFIKIFVESVGKMIDVVMPVIHREEALRNLKWRNFLDSMRLRSLVYVENLHLILTDSLRVLQRFFHISNVRIYSEDQDLARLLDLFSRADRSEKLYRQLRKPLTPADLLRQQLVLIRLRDISDGRVLLYFELPATSNRPLNPESPEQYLVGTDIWRIVNEEALIVGMSGLKDYLFFIITECLSSNPKATIAALNRRLPFRPGNDDAELLNRLLRLITERFGLFFDLFRTLSGNLESGLAFMRGRRDNLTLLYNRQHFKVLLNDSFYRSNRKLGLIFIDMDNFKIFNDAVSHDFGDKLLMALANRMLGSAEAIGQGAVPGRFGGDEFMYSIEGLDKKDFEEQAIGVFRSLTEMPLMVSFYFDDRTEGSALEINLIAFLHRLMRPDVGSRQASRTEYVERPHITPRAHVVDIWNHQWGQAHREGGGGTVPAERIVDDIAGSIEDKILYNKIFAEIDPGFRALIRQFVTLQIRDYTTPRIREFLSREHDAQSINRSITLKLSAGLAHGSEDRLRSTDSLFKAADNRTSMAKQNGRNCLFGVDGQRLL